MSLRQVIFVGVVLASGCTQELTPPVQPMAATQAIPSYDNETADYSLAPTTTIRTSALEGPTPTQINGAKTLTTPGLRELMNASPSPVVIDVIGGNQAVSLPGAIWLRGAGLGSDLNDAVQSKFAARLSELTGGDKARPVVFFCLSKTCWLSHNAVVRAVVLGYSNVYWYRGGRNAWKAAGLPMPPITPTDF